MPVGLPVGLGAARKPVSFDSALEATALGLARCIDPVARLEYADIDTLTHFDLVGFIDAELAEVPEQPVHGLQVPLTRLVESADLLETELYADVSIIFGSLDLRDDARPGLNHRNGVGRTVFSEHLGGADLFPY